MNFPSLFHVGCMKTGSTTLQEVLTKDERINLIKHSRFFNTDKFYTYDYPLSACDLVNVESDENIIRKYNNMCGFEESLKRINEVSKHCRLLIVIREQRSMILSGYKHHIRQTRDGYSLKKFAQEPPGISYIEMADFSLNVQTALKYFHPEQVLIVPYEWMRTDYHKFFTEIYSGFHKLIAQRISSS